MFENWMVQHSVGIVSQHGCVASHGDPGLRQSDQYQVTVAIGLGCFKLLRENSGLRGKYTSTMQDLQKIQVYRRRRTDCWWHQ